MAGGGPARRAIVVLTMLVLGLTSLDLGADAHVPETRALEQARQKVEQVARELQQAASTREQVEEKVARAQARLARVEEAVNAAAAALERQRMAVADARRHLEELRSSSQRLRRRMEDRAAALYMHGSALPFSMVLSADDLESAVARSEFVNVITGADRASLEQLAASRVAVRTQRQRFEREREHLAALKREQEELRDQVAHILEHRLMRLADVRERVHELSDHKERLEEEARRLTNLIKARQQRGRSLGPPSTAGYVWPLCGPVTSGYGRRWGRLHAGIDIDGNTGDPIVAAKGGIVIYAGWRGGYGRLTLVDHGDGVVTAYAHQSAIAVPEGEEVARGQRIGAVGNTGYSTGSHLHFETRVNGRPVDPLRFLPGGC